MSREPRAGVTEGTAPKLVYLDSLRGIASIVVVLAHYVGAFYPWAIFGHPYQSSGDWEKWLRTPPLSLVAAGHYAVCLFFILSGYVLSIRFVSGQARRGELVQAVLKRPLRLGGWVLFTVCVGYGLMSGGLVGPAQAHTRQALPWLATFWTTTPGWPGFARDILCEPFASSTTYNPPLWTIHKELVGSYIVFAYIALGHRLKSGWRLGLLFLVGALTARSLYVGFVIGVAFAEAAAARERLASRAGKALPLAMLVAGLWLGAQPHYLHGQAGNAGSGLWPAVASALEKFGSGGAAMLGAALTFAAVWHGAALQRALDRRLLRTLGRISFAVYALHFLVLGTLAAALHGSLAAPLGWHAAVAISTIVSLACLFPLAELLTRWVDRPSIAAGNIFARAVVQLVSRSLPAAAMATTRNRSTDSAAKGHASAIHGWLARENRAASERTGIELAGQAEESGSSNASRAA